MRVWIDIENPPQVQYLLPLKPALERAGADVTVTARDYGNAFELLDQSGVPYTPVGESYGAGKARKVIGLAGRTRALLGHFRRRGRPHASVSASRAAALVTRLLGRPPFVLIDYEHVSLAAFRVTRAFVLHPDVIPAEAFRSRGIAESRLIPFAGLKEDLSFAAVDPEGTDPHDLGAPAGLVRVLVRPAAEESHYYREESGTMTLRLLERLSQEEGAVVVFAPRYPRQVEYLSAYSWPNAPIVLDRAVPFVPLLKAVDLVISSGGTMLREAAYLGVPAYSLFQGEPGGVDRHLVDAGRLRLLRTAEDFQQIELVAKPPVAPLRANPQLADQLAETILTRARSTSPDG